MSCTEYRFLKTNFNFKLILILILILKLKIQLYLVRRAAIKQKEKATGYQTTCEEYITGYAIAENQNVISTEILSQRQKSSYLYVPHSWLNGFKQKEPENKRTRENLAHVTRSTTRKPMITSAFHLASSLFGTLYYRLWLIKDVLTITSMR